MKDNFQPIRYLKISNVNSLAKPPYPETTSAFFRSLMNLLQQLHPRITKAMTINVRLIGRVTKIDQSPPDTPSALRNSFSAIGPKITPKIKQGMEYPNLII
jgi:hypothetical protein